MRHGCKLASFPVFKHFQNCVSVFHIQMVDQNRNVFSVPRRKLVLKMLFKINRKNYLILHNSLQSKKLKISNFAFFDWRLHNQHYVYKTFILMENLHVDFIPITTLSSLSSVNQLDLTVSKQSLSFFVTQHYILYEVVDDMVCYHLRQNGLMNYVKNKVKPKQMMISCVGVYLF